MKRGNAEKQPHKLSDKLSAADSKRCLSKAKSHLIGEVFLDPVL